MGAGQQFSIPFLAHSDAQPAVCLLATLQLLSPSGTSTTAAAPDAVVQALEERLCIDAAAAGAGWSIVPQVFSTVLELLKASALPQLGSMHVYMHFWCYLEDTCMPCCCCAGAGYCEGAASHPGACWMRPSPSKGGSTAYAPYDWMLTLDSGQAFCRPGTRPSA